MAFRQLALLLLIGGLNGCAVFTRLALDQQYGRPDPGRFDTPRAPAPTLAAAR